MGSNLSKDTTPPPLTLQDCLVNGSISLSRYCCYRKSSGNYSVAIQREDTHWNAKRKRVIVVKEHSTFKFKFHLSEQKFKMFQDTPWLRLECDLNVHILHHVHVLTH